LHQATDPEGIIMRALRFQFHPEQIRISTEEILADLQYPVRRGREGEAAKPARRRRGRR
jgi:hypothetical protein